MHNEETRAARDYHEATRHTYRSVRSGGHTLDWENYPLTFKIYPNLEPIPLPEPQPSLRTPALRAVAAGGARAGAGPPPSLQTLADVLYFAAGITRRRRLVGGGEIYFRAYSNTGALYEIELYLVCGDLDGLPAGVYHFNPGDFALHRLRGGDHRGHVARATGGHEAVAHAPVQVLSTGTYWRNAWKYRTRTYRHFGWDNGTLLANLLAAAEATGLPAQVVLGFADAPLNHLLGLDTDREVTLSVVPLGRGEEAVPEAQQRPEPVAYETVPYSRREVDYPEMRAVHAATVLDEPGDAARWREGPTPAPATPAPTGELVPLAPLSEEEWPEAPVDRVILRRGSTRNFALHPARPVTHAQLSTILRQGAAGFGADFHDPPGAMLNALYLIAHDVEGLEPGSYVLHRGDWALERLQAGSFRREAGHLGLDQELPAVAAFTVFFLADLDAALARYGNRGYRAVQLEAGIVGGKCYLCSYALGLGATGLTFYDDEVVEFFSPHAAGRDAIFLMAFGKPAKVR